MPATGGAENLIIAGLPLVNDACFTLPGLVTDGTKIANAGMDDAESWGNVWTITPEGKDNTQLTLGTMNRHGPGPIGGGNAPDPRAGAHSTVGQRCGNGIPGP